ncbi:SPFH domain-containing protein [Micromonospora sp. NPDC003776]
METPGMLILDQKISNGTQNPVILRDAEFGVVRVRAFGAYAARVVDAQKLLRELVGTDPQFRTEEVQEYLRQLIVGRLGGALGTAGVPLLDLAAHQDAIGRRLAAVLTEELAEVGIAIPKFVIENVSVPPEVERSLDKRTSMGAVGDLDRFTRYQAATALEEAAKNPGGGAGAGIGLGMGMAAGQQMARGMAGAGTAPAAVPPPLPNQMQWYVGVAGQRQGPFDLGGLAEQVAAGALVGDTLVWRAGMAQWLPASQVPELASVLASVPPPLPPQ